MKAAIHYYRARAPLRLSFCGGGTDVSPYPEEHGGCVLSATINHYAYASLRPRRDPRLTLASLDYDVVAKYEHARRVKIDGTLDLLKAAVRALRVRRGADLWTHSDAPPGSGLGASSTLMVALLAVLREWLKLDLPPYDLAELAGDERLAADRRQRLGQRAEARLEPGAEPSGQNERLHRGPFIRCVCIATGHPPYARSRLKRLRTG